MRTEIPHSTPSPSPAENLVIDWSGYNPFIGSDTVVAHILFRPQVFCEARGLLLETCHRDRWARLGIVDSLVRNDMALEFLSGYFTK